MDNDTTAAVNNSKTKMKLFRVRDNYTVYTYICTICTSLFIYYTHTRLYVPFVQVYSFIHIHVK